MSYKLKTGFSLFLALIIVAVLFTVSDYLVHYFVPGFEVTQYPDYFNLGYGPLTLYAMGKFVGTILTGLIILFGFKKYAKKHSGYAWITFVVITVLALQARYAFSGYYTFTWLMKVLLLHTVLLGIISYFILKKRSNN